MKLIVAGILPAADNEYEHLFFKYLKKYPKILAISNVIHEGREEPVIYNKKFQKLVDACKKNGNNHKEFGALMGYTSLIDLHKFDYARVLSVEYYKGKETILSYWKPLHETLSKEIKLLDKMQSLDKDIKIKISVVDP